MSATAQEFRIDITARDNALAIIEKLKRSVQQTGQETENIGRSAQRAERGVSDLGAGFAGLKSVALNVAATLAGAFSGAAFMRAAREFTDLQNSLRVAGLEGDRLKQTYEQLFAIGQRQGVGTDGLANLFSGISQAARELNSSDADIMQFVDGVGVSLRVAGTNAQQASGALLQLRQALGGGTIQAEEFNSMLDGARPILQAVANGLVEAGGSVAKLRDLVREGEVSSEAFFRAFLAGRPVIEAMAQNAIPTLDQGVARVSNAFRDFAGRMDRVIGLSSWLGSQLGEIGDFFTGIVGPIESAISAMQRFGRVLELVSPRSMNNRELENFVGPMSPDFLEQNRRAQGVGLYETLSEAVRVMTSNNLTEPERAAVEGLSVPINAPVAQPPVRPVSLRQFGTNSGGSGSGSGSTGPSPFEQFQREIAGIEARRRALENEVLTLNMGTEAITRSKTAFDLREAAGRLNVELTPTLLASIDTEANAFARVTAELERQREAFRSQNEFIRFAGTSASSFFSDITSGGKNASEAVMNLTKRLADMALQSALLGDGPLAGLFGTRGQNGNVGGLFGALGSLFRPSVATVGPMNLIPSFDVGAWNVRNDGLAMIHKGETVLPTADAEDFRAGRAGGQQDVEVRVTIDDDLRLRTIVMRAANAAAQQAATQAISTYDRNLYGRVRQQEDAVI